MGYPDVVAYALDMLGMGAMDKDYAGLTPLHKAAFKGHHNNVRLLLKYGADPSGQVKGTRALHEGESKAKVSIKPKYHVVLAAIECPSPESVRALLSFGGDILLHNYNGQTPVDLAEATAREGEPAMRDYLCNLIADLQGRVPGLRSKVAVPVRRWNVSHAPDFHDPNHPESGLVMEADILPKSEHLQDLVFEMSNHILPPFYQLADRLGHWAILKDVKEHAKKTSQTRLASDLKNKGELLEIKKSELLRTGHSSLLDRAALEVRGQGKDAEEVVTMVKVDTVVKKILQVEEVQLAA